MQISNAELQIMKVIWTQESITSRQIIDSLSEKFSWTDSTVKTLLGRLVKKKALDARKDGKVFIYSPLLSEEECMKQITSGIGDMVCAVNITQIINNLIKDNEFTENDLNEIKKTITEKKKNTVEHVRCSCI